MTEPAPSLSAPTIAIRRCLPAKVQVLRMRRPSEKACRTFAEHCGLVLPAAGKVTVDGDARALWIGLNEWLIVGERSIDGAVAAIAAEAAACHVAEVTDALFSYEIAGSGSCALLSKGCTLDLHPRSFAPGRCAQTAFAQAAVTIERVSDTSFILYADRSFRRHLDLWCEDALLEFQSAGKFI